MSERYAIYARYSSDQQSPTSLEDQARKCREFARSQGWIEACVYEDAANSGFGADRKGFQRLLADAQREDRPFSIILVDDTSRLSRNLSDVLALYHQLSFRGVRVIAVSQGIDSRDEQSELLFTFHGMVDGLYVKELAKKTLRGLEGKALQGLSTGGRCFGYEAGSRWTIDEAEAAVVREIFELSANGYSLKRIAALLNERGTPPPRKRADRLNATWAPTCIRAMLRNEIYIGRKIWNQRKFVKRPGTNKRVSRPQPRNEWTITEVPELRIVSDELWVRVQNRQQTLMKKYAGSGRVSRAAHSPYLLSGFLVCSVCGARLIVISGTGKYATYGCSHAFNRGACSNRARIRVARIEEMLFRRLQEAFQTPEVIDSLVDALLSIQKKQRIGMEIPKRIKELEAQIENLVGAIAQVGNSETLTDGIRRRESELRELRVQQKEQKVLTPDDIRAMVRSALEDIPALLHKDPLRAKAKLAEHVDLITMKPQPDDSYVVEGEWDLLGNRTAPEMVAGAGFEPATFGL